MRYGRSAKRGDGIPVYGVDSEEEAEALLQAATRAGVVVPTAYGPVSITMHEVRQRMGLDDYEAFAYLAIVSEQLERVHQAMQTPIATAERRMRA